MTNPILLDDAALRALAITPTEMVEAIRQTLLDKVEGRFLTTPKSVITPGDGRYLMTTLSTGPELTVVKAVTVCPDNPSKGLPSITGSIMVLDAHTGETRAVMDAEWVTGIRTAGLSALAAKKLAKPDSQSMGFLGCGVQALSHLEIFSALFPLKSIRLYGRGTANIDRLCRAAAKMNISAEVVTDPAEVLSCDISVSSLPITFSGTPFADARAVNAGGLAIITDAAKPWIQEHLTCFETIVTDDLEQETNMPTPMVPPQYLTTDLAGLVSKTPPIGAGSRAFMFRGIAAGDYAAAALIWEKSRNIDAR